jgi:hypothetical protein
MAARIDYKISVTPIQDTSFEGKTIEAIDEEVGKTVGGGNSSLVWAGGAIDNWADGKITAYKEASTTAVPLTSDLDNGVFIRHTGKLYDSTKTQSIDSATDNIVQVQVLLASVELCKLEKNECIFIPSLSGVINIKSAITTGGVCPAVEALVLT